MYTKVTLSLEDIFSSLSKLLKINTIYIYYNLKKLLVYIMLLDNSEIWFEVLF